MNCLTNCGTDRPAIAPEWESRFRGFVQAAFGLRRKQLVRVVRTVASLDAERAAAIIASCGLTNDLRPEVLTPHDFARLVQAIGSNTPLPSVPLPVE